MAAPKGLKTTSSPLQISARIEESGANTFTTVEIPLTLNVLDNEVFVITQMNLDVEAPDMLIAGVIGPIRTASNASLSSTARTNVGNISDSNVIGSAQRQIITMVSGTSPDKLATATSFEREDPLFSAISEDYLGIVATNNMFLNLQGSGNLNGMSASVRVYGYRASAGSSVYAALVQSELLSA